MTKVLHAIASLNLQEQMAGRPGLGINYLMAWPRNYRPLVEAYVINHPAITAYLALYPDTTIQFHWDGPNCHVFDDQGEAHFDLLVQEC